MNVFSSPTAPLVLRAGRRATALAMAWALLLGAAEQAAAADSSRITQV